MALCLNKSFFFLFNRVHEVGSEKKKIRNRLTSYKREIFACICIADCHHLDESLNSYAKLVREDIGLICKNGSQSPSSKCLKGPWRLKTGGHFHLMTKDHKWRMHAGRCVSKQHPLPPSRRAVLMKWNGWECSGHWSLQKRTGKRAMGEHWCSKRWGSLDVIL